MPTTLPASVRDTLGEEAAGDFARWLDETLQQRTVERDERPDREGGSTPGVYREVLSRLDVLEERFDSRLAGMKEEFNGRLETMDAKLNRMNDRILSMTRWLIGLIALFGSLVTALPAVV